MLDIHFGASKDIAPKTARYCQFEEGAHRVIFATRSNDKKRFPKLFRIQDYSADTSFISEELPDLIEEIEETITRISSDAGLVLVLKMFRSACESAHKSNISIFCIAD